ncbi:alpha/beta hydrolase [Paucibacter soli]|uniref:alpha/beta hydrolase n=1 Tax=Paucibacter soli TaxID=3133433 RepID=UPI0030A4A425
MMIKLLKRALLGLALLVLASWAAFELSPWPSAWLLRQLFEMPGRATDRALAPMAPRDLEERLDLAYDAQDADAWLDLYRPHAAPALPVIVWVHGGGWISGGKGLIANYLRILAARGYAVVGVDYSLAPARQFPTPLRQLDSALAYLQQHAQALQIDADRIVLAGDSAGAQIVAQYANLMTRPAYAAELGLRPRLPRARLQALLLFCGAFDPAQMNLDGPYRLPLRTMFWSYLGRKDFRASPELLARLSVSAQLNPALPPLFITAGSADPLEVQSRRLAAEAAAQGLHVQTLFFPGTEQPRSEHVYQFKLQDPPARQALEQMLQFLARLGLPAHGV